MKLKVMITVLALMVGAQIGARDLAQIKNYRELEGLNYSKLPTSEQDQLLSLAVTSHLPAQSAAARSAISRQFKGINWNELVAIEANKGLNGVKIKLGLITVPTKASVAVTPAVTTPVAPVAQPAIVTPAVTPIVPLTKIEEKSKQLEKEVVKAKQEVSKQEDIVRQKEAEQKKFEQQEAERAAKAKEEIRKKEAAGKDVEAAALKKQQEADAQKAEAERIKNEAELKKQQEELAQKQQEQERLKREQEEALRVQQKKEALFQAYKQKVDTFISKVDEILKTNNNLKEIGNLLAGALLLQRPMDVETSTSISAEQQSTITSPLQPIIEKIEKKIQDIKAILTGYEQKINEFNSKAEKELKIDDLQHIDELYAEALALQVSIDNDFSNLSDQEASRLKTMLQPTIDKINKKKQELRAAVQKAEDERLANEAELKKQQEQKWQKAQQDIAAFGLKVDQALKNKDITIAALKKLTDEGSGLEEGAYQEGSKEQQSQVQATFEHIYEKIDARIKLIEAELKKQQEELAQKQQEQERLKREQEEAAGAQNKKQTLLQEYQEKVEAFIAQADQLMANGNLQDLESLKDEGTTLAKSIIEDKNIPKNEMMTLIVATLSPKRKEIDKKIEELRGAIATKSQSMNVEAFDITDADNPKPLHYQDVTVLQEEGGDQKVIKISYANNKTITDIDASQPTANRANLGHWIAAQVFVAQQGISTKDAAQKLLEQAQEALRLDEWRDPSPYAGLYGYLNKGLIPVLTNKVKKFNN